MGCIADRTTRTICLGTALTLAATLVAQPAAPVAVERPAVGRAAQIIELTGSFHARRAAALSPRISGLVASVAVDAGDRVRIDDVLVTLDGRLAELAVSEAQAAVGEREASFREAQRLLAEAQRLSGEGHLPETQVHARESAVSIAEAALARARSELAAAQERLLRHTIVAPFSGTVARKLTEAGEWVDTGAAVLELVDAQQLWLDVQAPQEHWSILVPDAHVMVRADALPQREMIASVHARVPVSDASARTLLIRLVVEDLPADITPGMSARVRFELPGAGELLQVSRDAIIRYPDGTTTVWVIDDSDDLPRAREVPVQLGRYAGDRVEVLGGVTRGQLVVIRGNEILIDQQPVRIIESPSDPAKGAD